MRQAVFAHGIVIGITAAKDHGRQYESVFPQRYTSCGRGSTIHDAPSEVLKMRVLVVHASRYGATQGIAERIAATLHQHGLETKVEPVEQADPEGYDAVVIGSAAYYFHWLKKTTEFVRRNRTVFADRPVWLFSSGPLGTDSKDAQGRDLRVVAEPGEITEFREVIHPRDHRVFFGALDRKKLGLMHGLVLKMFASVETRIFQKVIFATGTRLRLGPATLLRR